MLPLTRSIPAGPTPQEYAMNHSSSPTPSAASTAALAPQPYPSSPAAAPRAGAPAGPHPQTQAPDTDPGALEYQSWLRQLQAARP